MPEFTEYDT